MAKRKSRTGVLKEMDDLFGKVGKARAEAGRINDKIREIQSNSERMLDEGTKALVRLSYDTRSGGAEVAIRLNGGKRVDLGIDQAEALRDWLVETLGPAK